MKKLLFILIAFVSCNYTAPKEADINKRLVMVNNALNELFTESELSSFKISEYEISGKDYHTEIHNYLSNKLDYYNEMMDNSPNISLKEKWGSHANGLFEGIEKNINEIDRDKDSNYYKIISVRGNSDTTHYSVFYFNSLDSLVFRINYK